MLHPRLAFAWWRRDPGAAMRTLNEEGSARRRPHVAVLVLLAAAAGARFVAADLVAAVADRLLLLVAGLAAGDGGLLLGLHRAVGDLQARGGLVHHLADHEHRFFGQVLVVLHAE